MSTKHQRLFPTSFLRSTGLALVAGLALVPGCDSSSGEEDHGDEECHAEEESGDHGHSHGECGEETEVISRVVLTFTPDGGGTPVVAQFDDPDGDGGMSGVSDPITLAAGTTYTLGIEFFNGLETPAEDITAEVRAEAEEHLILIYGDGVMGPASTSAAALVTHSYADLESDYGMNAVGDDLVVGLSNTIVADAAGEAKLSVMLRHLPELNGAEQKGASLPADFAGGGALPGDVDVDVSFDLTVQ